MENPAATLHCPNNRCQAANPQSHKFCQNCRTPLLRRYLWAIGAGISAYKPGEAIAHRYIVVDSGVVLDTKPALPPDTPQEIPPNLLPYLRLFPYRLHLPQVYGRLVEQRQDSEIWLLEDVPILGMEAGEAQGQLRPELSSTWKNAPPMRQLNWLWQLANLWQPLSSEGVAASLLKPSLLRVEGSLVRLLELQADSQAAPTLQQLGQLWLSHLSIGVSPAIARFFQQLCTQLVEEQIQTSEQLVALLDQGLKTCGGGQDRTYQILTRTDSGPTRHHNEDACYPTSGQLIGPVTNTRAVAIVCDGIGGHEGGEVASHVAIDTLQQQIENLSVNPENWNPTALTLELEEAACAANDAISQQNDSEHRSDRQRMGTTLVMAQTHAHEIYITHVGDSRVYWITRNGCHQVTQDDDLASREVRLGYALYRNAVQQPTSGSLVQALGMAPSATLHPTTQRFVLDEDSVFLLCSDGLSDNDRVEQYWQTEILPILDSQVDLPTAGARLLEIGNRQNGHDNITIALVYCQVNPSGKTEPTELSPPKPESLPANLASTTTTPVTAAPSRMKTRQLPTTVPTRRPWRLLLGILVLLVVGGGLAYLLIPRSWVDPVIGLVSSQGEQQNPSSDSREATPTASPPVTPSPTDSLTLSPSQTANLEAQDLIRVNRSTIDYSDGRAISLVLRLEAPSQNQSPVRLVPGGSVLQVIERSPYQRQDWLKLKICSPGTGNIESQQPDESKASPETAQNQVEQASEVPPFQQISSSYPSVQKGQIGWIKETHLLRSQDSTFEPKPTYLNECKAIGSSPTPTPTSVEQSP
ncbi:MULTISPECIES: protein phosphatase 2C domain-containing protein [unclassified Coleofasciculus]|uniref:protein phosphatase 2C domain-containing protein n=1 Tax=unclassified Coleofasciculus TaxID=2692782 RepID=UPI0018820369|nr:MULTISPECIES: protein phosphatase 2C domain-containing protein [unclassified Coleofasciculus]MBE9129695.1 protein phosphatase 2C domain-containing protein [Coleofasciculus sp. LEGE 07081]MBE9152203.1 protein phosphatase 2C domain-containing protein [Coleofasciculus sp. LEGE 07092]